jgi:hypothetical protein
MPEKISVAAITVFLIDVIRFIPHALRKLVKHTDIWTKIGLT